MLLHVLLLLALVTGGHFSQPTDPCVYTMCAVGHRCKNGLCFPGKVGICPTVTSNPGNAYPGQSCSNDDDCPAINMKCCSNACGGTTCTQTVNSACQTNCQGNEVCTEVQCITAPCYGVCEARNGNN